MATGRTNQSIVDDSFVGDYDRWSFGYPWMLQYIGNWYEDIIGNQGLSHYVKDFPHYHKAIEQSVQRERHVEKLDGSYNIVPGLNLLPWDVFEFIDDSIYRICKPFSGPRGDYVGAARKEEFEES